MQIILIACKEKFFTWKRKCSYESVVEMPDLVLVLLLTYFYTFVLVCILVDYSWMGSQAVYLYRSQPTWNLSFQIMVCYVKLFIYEEVVSKMQLVEYSSLSIFFLFHHLYDTVLLLQKGLKVIITWWHLCIVEAAQFHTKKDSKLGKQRVWMPVRPAKQLNSKACSPWGRIWAQGYTPGSLISCTGTLGFFKQAFSINA